jgi:hypothetical protein
MSRYWTYAEIRQKLEEDLDLEQEIFVGDNEVLGYVNEGVDICEGKIHALYEDYFLSKAPLTLVSGTSEYALPADIYAHKIRAVIYRNGSDVFNIKRTRNIKKALNYEVEQVNGSSGSSPRYEYFLLNSTPGEPEIVFTPPVGEAGQRVFVWYLRNANRMVEEEDICDIPEFVYYVIQFAKVQIMDKEGHPGYTDAKIKLDELEAEMLTTLADMVPDEDNEIEPDFSAYDEMT